MKIRFNKKSGSALLVTIVVTAVLGTALASYMKLVEYQNRSVVRSQYWNASIPMSEAGIEEALTHLNKIGNGSRDTNGWALKDGKYYMQRSLGDSSYEVYIDGQNQPTITSVGKVQDAITQKTLTRTVKVTTTKTGSLWKGIICRNSLSMNGNCKIDSFDSTDPLLSTNGKYDPAKAHDMGYAGSVTSDVYLEGAGVWGYAGTGPNGTATGNAGDSAWMASHTGIQPGHYANDLNLALPDVALPFSGGGLAPEQNKSVTVTNYTYLNSQVTTTTLPSPLPVGGVTTNFTTITTPTKPAMWVGTLTTNTATMSSTTYPASGTYIGNVVTRNVVTGNGNKKVTKTYYDYTVISGYSYQGFSYTYNTTTTNATTTTSNYSYVTDTGNYQLSSLSLSGQSEFLVKGDTTLYITGNWSMAGQSQITILPGASLKVYVAGSVSLSGNGIMNYTQNAAKFTIYGLPTCTTMSLSGNAAFTGTIYAPSANLSLNGGGNNIYDCVGAVIVNSAYFNGHFNFHYDEMLGRTSGPVQYKVASWNEI